jgi:hypothetical protein
MDVFNEQKMGPDYAQLRLKATQGKQKMKQPKPS